MMTLPQLFSAVSGMGICVYCMVIFVRRKTHRFKALFWMAIGMSMVYAAFRPHMIELIGPDSVELRLRLVISLLSFTVLTITLETVRIGRMQERYAFLWLVTGGLLFVGAMFPDLAVLVSHVTGMHYGMSVMVLLFSFLLFLLFHVSIALSRIQQQLGQTVRKAALVEERLRRLEGEHAPRGASAQPPSLL